MIVPRRARDARVAFLDLEGTLLRGSILIPGNAHPLSQWPAIAASLGKEAVAAELVTQEKWKAGDYAGYVEWVEATCELHKKFGLTRDILNKLVENAQLMPGASELVDYLHASGFKTALITGAVKAFADKVQRELRIGHSLAACEYFFDSVGRLEFWNTLPCDALGKKNFMKVIIEEHGARSENCVFVGDGDNDVDLAKSVGVSVSFNGSGKLNAVSTIRIQQDKGQENLSAVVQELRKHV